MTLFGQVRSVRSIGLKDWYLVDGLRNMMFSHSGSAPHEF
jgi:hypothetical protein